MHTYCIIPTTTDNFCSFAAQLPIAAEYKEIIQNATVTKVQINPTESAWEIFIEVRQPVPAQVWKIAEQQLCTNCGLSAVSFVSCVCDITTLVKENWSNFVQCVANNNETTKQILLSSCRRLEEQNLIIETHSDLSLEVLTQKGIVNTIKTRLQEKYGFEGNVYFTTAKTVPEDISSNDFLTDEYLEALQGCTAEPPKNPAAKPVIFGRNIKADPQLINTVQDENRDVVISGEVVAIEPRDLRSGRSLLSFDVVDTTDGISCKLFIDKKEDCQKLSEAINIGMFVKVKGLVKYDKFSNEYVMYPDSICRLQKDERVDTAKTPRVELHAHTRMSSMDSVASVKKLITTAAKWGHPAVAITDHGVVQAFPEAHETACKAGIKIIYGMEAYLFTDDINHARHIILLACNNIGLRNLYRMVSLSHLNYYHRTPRLPKHVIAEYREGLLLGSACEAGELIQAILQGDKTEDLLQIANFYDYLEIQPIANNGFLVREGKVENEEALRNINRKVCELGEHLNKPVVATCDVHFLEPEDEVYRRILMAGKGFADADHQPPLYFRTTEEMLAEFSYLGAKKAHEIVISNSRKINDRIESIKPIPDEKLYSPKIPGAENQIRTMANERARHLYGDPLPQIVSDRLMMELNSIINNGFAVLYLIAHKLVKKSLDDGFLVGSRGSVGSSFVATMTGITEVNPLAPHWRCPTCKYTEFVTDGSYGSGFDLPDKACPHCHTPQIKDGHDIPFAVFMGFHGDKVPDIDLNFSGEYQPTAHKYTEELFGKDNVFRAGTIATIADKTAYGFVKNYFADKGQEPRNAQFTKLINGCSGVKRTTGQHPGGIMVVPRDMDVHHFTPIQRPADDKNSATITTHFDYHSISSRLVKLDILGHDDPTVIKMLEDLTGIDAKTIPLDDPATLSLFLSPDALNVSAKNLGSPVGTFGIPEFGTKFVRQMLEDTKPTKFSELVRISGFSHGTDVWLNNAQDLIKNGTAQLSEAISARDDIMMYLIHKGVEPQLAFKIMEGVRKGKGIKPDDCARMRENQVPEWYIDSCQKIKYMFPKAHAVAYVMMAFRIAYCKVHLPMAFYAAYFSIRATEFDADIIVQGIDVLKEKLKELDQRGNTLSAKEKSLQTICEVALEMYLRGLTFQRVNLDTSDANRFIITAEQNSLLPPLASLQGLGDSAAANIVAARQEAPFSSIDDLRMRGRASKTVIDILRGHGCLEHLPETAQMQLFG
ncbi:MAG: PolC-type DNA polymerase III [Negativicutes bacterium]